MDLPVQSPGSPPSPDKETFLEIDADILKHALELFRDLFRPATQATIFLERKCRVSSINIGIANMRDAASHLATLLNKRGQDRKVQLAQLDNIEEHIRRAVMEPYERTVHLLEAKFLDLLERYKTEVLGGSASTTEFFKSAPSLREINASLEAIDRLCEQGRLAKLENTWTESWEAGVKSYVEAVEDLQALTQQVEHFIFAGIQTRRQDELKRLSENLMVETIQQGQYSKRYSLRMMIVGAVASAILGTLLGVGVTNYLSRNSSARTAGRVSEISCVGHSMRRAYAPQTEKSHA